MGALGERVWGGGSGAEQRGAYGGCVSPFKRAVMMHDTT